MATSAHPVDQRLTAIAIAYKNNELIADLVSPRFKVPTEKFSYRKMTKADGFTIPATQIGRESFPNEVKFSSSEVPAIVKDYGLMSPVPVKDVNNAPAGFDPLGNATLKTTELLSLAREVRVATQVTTLANFQSTLRATLSGTDQFSHASSDPVLLMQNAIDAMLVKPSHMVMGRAVYSVLRRHPKILGAAIAQGLTIAGGAVSKKVIAEIFELQDVYVGEGWVNTAAPNLTPVFARVWGKDLAILRIEKPLDGDAQGSMTFTATPEFGTREVTVLEEAGRGVKGTKSPKVVEQLDEVIMCDDAGYLLKAAVA